MGNGRAVSLLILKTFPLLSTTHDYTNIYSQKYFEVMLKMYKYLQMGVVSLSEWCDEMGDLLPFLQYFTYEYNW